MRRRPLTLVGVSLVILPTQIGAGFLGKDRADPRILRQDLDPAEKIVDDLASRCRIVLGNEVEDVDQTVEPRGRPLHTKAHPA